MKKIKTLLISLLSLSFMLASCEGPTGPPGRDGFDGRDGSPTFIFEIADVDFEKDKNYSFGDIIPDDIPIDDSDLVLIYRSNELNSTGDDVWQLLPQAYFLDQGTLQVNFNHTKNDFEIIIDSNFNLDDLTPDQVSRFLTNQIFRIAVVSVNTSSVNTSAKILNDSRYNYETISQGAQRLNFTE
ncbi:hypothetical protein [Aquimarina agarilytica]|uniref:hypothetical protein n=1 Tax=Aquimarina agarilytica TaxID=1087449 RepID=UPI0002886DD2|nr:hypothetical protein [Aquimarina agarilytica]